MPESTWHFKSGVGKRNDDSLFIVKGGSEGGGISNEILMLNKESMIWTKTGYMQEERYHHAISALPYDDLEPHCFFG